jgi:dihydropyrimidinase
MADLVDGVRAGVPHRCDMAVTGGEVVTEQGIERLTVAVQGERILALLSPEEPVEATETVDARGMLVLPGAIDTHTHICWPFDGETTAETVDTATRAALAGGTTTVVDFAPLARDEDEIAALERRLAAFEGASRCDFSFHSILVSAGPRTMRRIPELVDRGIASFKLYTTFDDRRIGDGEAWDLVRCIAEHGGMPVVHAENDAIINRRIDDMAREGAVALADFPASRPEIAEAQAIATFLTMAEALDAPLYVLHLTSPLGLALIRRAQAAGIPVVTETCPQYLVYADEVFDRPDAWRYVITPPPRSAQARAALWAGLADGTIGAISSDHCAYGLAQKYRGDSFAAIPFGAPGIQERLPIVFDRAVASGLTVEQVVRAVATEPARMLGLYPRKGVIAPGSDADLVIFDPESPWRFDDDSALTGEYTIYHGLTGRGAPASTMLRGRIVTRGDEGIGDPGGLFLPRRLDRSRLRSPASAPR